MSLDLSTRVTFWNVIASGFFNMTSGVSFHQNCAQRLVSLPSLNKAKRLQLIGSNSMANNKKNEICIERKFDLQGDDHIFHRSCICYGFQLFNWNHNVCILSWMRPEESKHYYKI